MDYQLSRSEKKRRAKGVEELAVELVALSAQLIDKLPCDEAIKAEIRAARPLKAGARKRQIKYLTKQLRRVDTQQLLAFMEEEKGSRLKQAKEFHELEKLRDAIINEALAVIDEQEGLVDEEEEELPRSWSGPALDAALSSFPELDANAARQAARRFVRTRQQAASRELFRLLKAAAERRRWHSEAASSRE